MSRFRKLSQTIWHCQYYIMWTPKYRYRILTGQLGLDVDSCIRAFSDQLKCEITELNVQIDHVHLLVMVPPKISISDYVGIVNPSCYWFWNVRISLCTTMALKTQSASMLKNAKSAAVLEVSLVVGAAIPLQA